LSTDDPRKVAIPSAPDEEARRLQAVLDALPLPIFFKDASGAYRGFNVAFERYLGVPRERLLGRSVFDVAPRDLAEVYREADDRLLRSGGTQVYETRVQWADGACRNVVFHKAVLAGADGAAAGLVGAMLDVTAQREAERSREAALETARVAQRLAGIGTLAAGVAHELNNPLTYVLSNLEQVAASLQRLREAPRGAEAWDDAADAVDDALEGAERMRVILRDLRTLAHPDAEADGAATDVRAVLEYAAALASTELRRRARLVWEIGDVPPVRGGEGRLGQVLVNLLVNAAHATPEGNPAAHVVRLSAAPARGGKVCIAVEDRGVGIPPEHLPRLFDPFFTTKPAGVGTGLGLWVCQSIVHAAGGAIEVESEVGRGTTVRILLPAAETDAPAPRADRDRALPRVLVVDDEPLATVAVRRQLASEFRVESATGPADARRRVSRGAFDAVLCDLLLEDCTGLDVVEAIRSVDPALGDRVLLVGAAAPPEIQHRLAATGARVLPRPIGRRLLREALREVIGTAVG
jgi:PAS domain S-box-containing protein